jgi:two-component system, NtrC family, sensor histidine kinase PilS
MPEQLVKEERAPKRPRPPTQLPELRRLLGWVYLGRLIAVVAVLGRGVWELHVHSDVVFLASALLALTVLFTAGSYWYSHRLGHTPSLGFLVGQSLFDVVLVSAVVSVSGGGSSLFTPLYILVICAAALLLPLFGGVLVGALIIALYLYIVWRSADVQPGIVVLQVALFAIVSLVTSYLGDRLRRTGTALDVAETELRQLRLDTGDILSTISTGIITVDGQGRLAYLNPAAEELLGLSFAELANQPVLPVLDRVAPGLGAVMLRTANARTPIRRFETEPLSDETFVLGVSTTLVERDGADERPVVTAIFQDITQKMRAEALRRRAERLEAVAELSASLAHEIKNPLASIRSAVEQIGTGAVDAEDSELLTRLVVRESDRLSRLLTEFIDFARVQVTAPLPLFFPEVVRQVVELVRAHPDAEGCEIELRVEGDPGEMLIRGAEDLLHRAVLNLALNGVQWAGPGGRVVLALDEVRSDLLSPALGALSLVRLTVTDSGPGIEEEIVDEIFNPFFTRRAGGTGLGLALVQRAVEAHGGAIFVDNAPADSGMGATFSLYLPALPPEPSDASEPETAEETSTL